jgi:hypothetical protein
MIRNLVVYKNCMTGDLHHLTVPPRMRLDPLNRLQRLHLEKEMKEGVVADDVLVEAVEGIQMEAEVWKVQGCPLRKAHGEMIVTAILMDAVERTMLDAARDMEVVTEIMGDEVDGAEHLDV